MATIKQLKIGNTNYDIKALNATNNNTADFVVRDIKYGTADPSGGSAGQVYLQYNTDTTSNPYIYAEDEVGSSINSADKYYSKNEVDQMIAAITQKITHYNYAWSGNGDTTVTFSPAGNGYMIIQCYYKVGNSTDDYGQIGCYILKSNNGGSSYGEIARNEHRKHGSGYVNGPAVNCCVGTTAGSNIRLRCQFSKSYDATGYWRVEILSVGTTVTKI